jgi:type I restriction enzyme M protein
MAQKREVLQLLARDELVAIVDPFELEVADRRAKDGLIEAVAASKKARLTEILTELTRGRLKGLCRALELDYSGREKAVLVGRLVGVKTATVAQP